jgi:hypothetical protein
MNTTRLLLPFTHGVDRRAIEHALQLAQDREATLVPLVLIHIPDQRSTRGTNGIRLEQFQQAQDFLECVRHAAARYHVAVEGYEVATTNVIHSIAVQARAVRCESIIILADEKQGLLLQTYEIEALLAQIPLPCELIHVQYSYPATRNNNSLWLSWLSKGNIRSDSVIPKTQNAEVLTAVGQGRERYRL